jgi:hypothetical protein
MPLKSIIAFLLSCLSSTAQAAACPSPHFEPTTYYGQAFFDSRPVTGYDLTKKDEDYAFQYIEYQTFEEGYEPVYTVSLLRNEAGHFRVALVRAKNPLKKGGEPKTSATSRDISATLGERISNAAASILLRTRYPDNPCELAWLDGYSVQAMAPRVEGYGDLVGEVYSPPSGTEAASIVTLGRTLRSFVEQAVSETEVESATVVAEGHNNSFKPKPLRGSA